MRQSDHLSPLPKLSADGTYSSRPRMTPKALTPRGEVQWVIRVWVSWTLWGWTVSVSFSLAGCIRLRLDGGDTRGRSLQFLNSASLVSVWMRDYSHIPWYHEKTIFRPSPFACAWMPTQEHDWAAALCALVPLLIDSRKWWISLSGWSIFINNSDTVKMTQRILRTLVRVISSFHFVRIIGQTL